MLADQAHECDPHLAASLQGRSWLLTRTQGADWRHEGAFTLVFSKLAMGPMRLQT